MPPTLTMNGLYLRVDGPILEMRPDSDRSEQSSSDGGRLLSLFCTDEIRGILFDRRQADYALTQTQLHIRALSIARRCKGKSVAYVARMEQGEQAIIAIQSHTDMGSACRLFRSRSKARDWLVETIAPLADTQPGR
jgi:hypothetical protein